MTTDTNVLTVEFSESGKRIDVDTADMAAAMMDFLEFYSTAYLVGDTFSALVGSGNGRDRFQRLIRAAGFENDADGFCTALSERLIRATSDDPGTIVMGGIQMPMLLMAAALKSLIPGSKYVSIRDVDQLEQQTNITVPADQRADMQSVIDTYPVRLSLHTIRQMRISPHVAYQYLPFVEELDPVGHTNTWIGQFHQGLLEQMYQNRVIFLLNMSCPVYCRFCFRKHKESRQAANPTVADVQQAVDHVAVTDTIKEIVVTGGDPFLNRANMAATIDGLREVPHVQTLRLATRSIAYYPHLFLNRNRELLSYLELKHLELQRSDKRLEVATHFIHPDEISIESLDIISSLVRSGVGVYVQTPFLKDCNDQGPELVRLFSKLRGAGAELHYIYIPCSPIHGNSIYWTPIITGHEVARYLRAHLSDRAIPRICTATPIGKMDWHSSGWAVEPDDRDERFMWIRTPYTPAYFKSFAPMVEKLHNLRENEEGTIDVSYMARAGDPGLFMGARPARPPKQVDPPADLLASARQTARQQGTSDHSMVPTGVAGLTRPHLTRVVMDAGASDAALDYLRSATAVTDVVVTADTDIIDRLPEIRRIASTLAGVDHVNALRLRSLSFNDRPDRYTDALVAFLGTLNRLAIARPLRLEIETQFLTADEITLRHRQLATALSNHGITVYNNTPLLTDINDSAEQIHRLAYRLRSSGIEFHHLYVAGQPVQAAWNQSRPVDVADVIDIGSMVRREGSGREIPRYIIDTPLGEVDFGLTSRLHHKNGAIEAALTCYHLDYYRQMDPGFQWPANVATDNDGAPVVPVPGLTDTGGFMVF